MPRKARRSRQPLARSVSAAIRRSRATRRARAEARARRQQQEQRQQLVNVMAENAALNRQQAVMQDNEDRYLEIFDFAPVTYAMLDPAGIVKQINQTGCRMFGVECHQIVDHPLLQYVAPDDRRVFLDHLRECRAGSTLVESAVRFQKPNGEIIHCLMYGKSAAGRDAKILGVLIADETDRLKLDAARRDGDRHRAEAEHARETARADIAAKDKLLAMVSHELRTPLTPALIAATLLARATADNPELHRLAETARRNIELEASLVDDLLDLAKISGDRVDLRQEVVDLHRIVESAVEICRPVADSGNVTIGVYLLADRSRVSGDEPRLRQVFWNLLNNGIKFCDSGGMVQVRSVNPSGDTIRVAVQDNGGGMDRQTLGSLFSPFEPQMPHGGARRGLGLGLTICKRILDAHGAQIWAASEGPGRGSVFEVELPLAQIFGSASDSEGVVETEDEGRPAVKAGVRERKKRVRGD